GILGWLDASTVMFVAPDGQLYALPITGGPARQLTRGDGRVSAPTASPDGNLIACMVSTRKDQHIAIVDPTGEEWPRRASRGAAPAGEAGARWPWRGRDFVLDRTIWGGGAVAGQGGSVPDRAGAASRVWLMTPDGERKVIDGGRDGDGEPVSATQPRVSPDGK